MADQPEVWLRGPLTGYPPLLMPVAHALLQSREEIQRMANSLPAAHAWVKPGGAASVGFHLVHAARSIDRLTTYARGEMLNEAQLRALKAEERLERDAPPVQQAADEAIAAIDRALDQLRTTPEATLTEARQVGRKGLPSTVIGLLVHTAEHTTRHIGQALTTAKILAGRPQ